MHSIQLICAPIEPQLQVACREVEIAQVVMNLIQNAVDAVAESRERPTGQPVASIANPSYAAPSTGASSFNTR
jgi:nitrogen fixation/metabolism regulation signal transduction histidine kinase